MQILYSFESSLFYIMYGVYLVDVILSESNYCNINGIGKILFLMRILVTLGMLGIIFLNKKIDIYKLIYSFCFAIFLILSIIIKQNGISLVFMLLIVIASKNKSLEKIFKITIKATLFTYCFVYLSSLLGIIENTIVTRQLEVSFWSGEYQRVSMGFFNANQVPLTVLYLFFMYIVQKKDKIKYYEIFLILIVGLYVYEKCNARTPLLLLVLTCFMYVIMKNIKTVYIFNKRSSIYRYLWVFIFPMCTIISFLLAAFYSKNSGIMQLLDAIFNHRISLAHDALFYYGIGILGHGKNAGTYAGKLADNTVDNGYIVTFIQSGIIIGIGIILMWAILTWLSIKYENKYILLILLMIAIANLIDCQFSSYRTLPFYCILFNEKDSFLEYYKNSLCIKLMSET